MRQWIDLFENADVDALEARFGNDNYPWHHEDDEYLTPEEIAELDAENPNREKGPAIIDGCGPWFSCDSWAEYVVQQLPGRAVAYGFWCEDNPGTEIEDFCDGHTFAIVDDRYIVDGWIKNVEGILPRAVFDLNDPADADIIKKYYGPRENWKPINKTLYQVFGMSDKERWNKALDRQIGDSSSSKGIGDALRNATSRLPQLSIIGIENKRRDKSTRRIADYKGVRIEFDASLGSTEVERLTGYVREAHSMLSRHGLEKILKMGPIVFLPFSKRNSGYTGFSFGTSDKTILINSDQYGDELETIIHECGHRLHFVVPSSLFPRIFKFWTTKRTYDWFVSDYAKTNANEFFAELFMAYVYDNLSAEPRAWMDRFVQKYIH